MTAVSANRPTATTTVIRVRLFFSSYAPLFLLLALRLDDDIVRVIVLFLGAAGVLDAVRLVLWQPRRIGPSPYTVREVADHGSQVAGYLVAYLLPFLAIAHPTASDLAAYALFLLIVAVIFVRSEMAEINPTLYLLGRRVVQIKTEEAWSGFAVVRGLPQPGDTLRAAHLDQGILVEVRG